MASSSYYYRLYKEKKNEVEKYEKWIKQVEKIRTQVITGLEDEIRVVNQKINALVEDLKAAVKHNAKFADIADDIGDQTEYSAGRDSQLSKTASSLQDELMRLGEKKNNAHSAAQSYYNQYLEAKRQEEEERERQRQEALDRLKNAFGIN